MFTKEFIIAALQRAFRTLCQTAVATIGSTAVISEVNWLTVASASVLAAVLSLLTSFGTGLPEAHNERFGDLPESSTAK